MNLLLVLIFTHIFIFPTNLVAQSAEDSQKTNQSTTDKSAQARLYKEQGEQLISQDKTEPAADAFSKALSLDRDTFSPAERVRMAIYLSWADRLQEAEKELKKLADAISQEASPQVDFRYNYYTDSDGNRLNRYSLLSSFWLGDQKFETNFRHTDANDKGHNRAEDLAFKVYSHLTDWLAGGVGLGFTQLGDGEASNFPTG